MTHRPAEHFAQLLRTFETAMLVAFSVEGHVRTRPMSIASVDNEGHIWLATGLESEKSAETFSGNRVAVVMQSAKRFVSITGTAELIDELGFLCVRATDAQFWDLDGLRGFVYLFDAVRSAVRGERGDNEPASRHDVVSLHQQSDDAPPTLTGWLKSHLHESSRRRARSDGRDQSLGLSGSAETVRPLESNAGETEQTPNG